MSCSDFSSKYPQNRGFCRQRPKRSNSRKSYYQVIFCYKTISTHKSWIDSYPKPHLWKKKLDQNSKAKAMWPPITKKAGLQDRPFLVFSYQQDLKVLKITLVFYCCGSLVIYILPVFSTVPRKKSLFENFMLWYLCCRISNYGDYGPLGYGLSCCGGHCSGTCTFIHFHLGILCTQRFDLIDFV